jgi:hypothetical protein
MKPQHRDASGGRSTMTGFSYVGLHHVKFPVTDLDTSLQWYETVLKAKREPRFDHMDANGKPQIDEEVRR